MIQTWSDLFLCVILFVLSVLLGMETSNIKWREGVDRLAKKSGITKDEVLSIMEIKDHEVR